MVDVYYVVCIYNQKDVDRKITPRGSNCTNDFVIFSMLLTHLHDQPHPPASAIVFWHN